ncbi:hypothetical protein KL86PLE_41456 [uncultured Pleomorphomonas sp.]|uniref:Uncharacterized protein n=1 Tax=uncultured Pleomorphomonas sp. TaxID=442121 RepID=A0A212LJC9_9HYPH|nr:hypothetical protein KL86PLE_41456 [uncultured Pleomorphomonas sp.]
MSEFRQNRDSGIRVGCDAIPCK